jgi:hypothetical protein
MARSERAASMSGARNAARWVPLAQLVRGGQVIDVNAIKHRGLINNCDNRAKLQTSYTNLCSRTLLISDNGCETQRSHPSVSHQVALPPVRQALDVGRSWQQMSELPASKMPMEVLERGSGSAGGTARYRKGAQEAQEAIQSCRSTVTQYKGLVLFGLQFGYADAFIS